MVRLTDDEYTFLLKTFAKLVDDKEIMWKDTFVIFKATFNTTTVRDHKELKHKYHYIKNQLTPLSSEEYKFVHASIGTTKPSERDWQECFCRFGLVFQQAAKTTVKNKKQLEKKYVAYWTTLQPNETGASGGDRQMDGSVGTGDEDPGDDDDLSGTDDEDGSDEEDPLNQNNDVVSEDDNTDEDTWNGRQLVDLTEDELGNRDKKTKRKRTKNDDRNPVIKRQARTRVSDTLQKKTEEPMERVAVVQSLFDRLIYLTTIINRNEMHRSKTLTQLGAGIDNRSTETHGYVNTKHSCSYIL
jgi:hypothetical protein